MSKKNEKLLRGMIEKETELPYTISKNKGGHSQISIGGTARELYTSSSPSDKRSYLNLRRDVRTLIKGYGRGVTDAK